MKTERMKDISNRRERIEKEKGWEIERNRKKKESESPLGK
jgi:hypothetical protein